MPGAEIEVRVVVGPADAHHLDSWSRFLSASVDRARAAGTVDAARVLIGDARDEADRARRPLDDHRTIAGVEWVTVALEPGTGWSEGHNVLHRAAPPRPAGHLLLVDPDVYLSSSCLHELVVALKPGVGLVEPRHLPIPRRDPIDPDFGRVSTVSRECLLIRAGLLERLEGLDSASFPVVGADADLSWRARAAGWFVVRQLSATVFLQRPGPDGKRSEGAVPAELGALLLCAKYKGPWLARALAAGWSTRGTAQQQEAARLLIGREYDHLIGQAQIDGGGDFMDELLLELAGRAAEAGLYDWRPAAGSSDVIPAAPPATSDSPWLTVVVRTQGRRPEQLADALHSLASQNDADFEVIVAGHDLDEAATGVVAAALAAADEHLRQRLRLLRVGGGNRSTPLNAAIAQARGQYVAFLDDDDVALAGWVAEFRRAAEEQPGAIAWTQVAWQTMEEATVANRPAWLASEPPQLFVPRFDLFAHIRQNGTPNCGIAVPVECFRTGGLRFREDIAVYEDWDVVLRLAQIRPFRPTGRVTALYRRASTGNSGTAHPYEEWERAEQAVKADMDRTSFVVRGEYLPELRQALDELDALRRAAEANDWGVDDTSPDSRAAEAARELMVADSAQLLQIADGPTAILSPHLDDAVLSCGDLISRLDDCVVVTVFAGDDVDWSELAAWDAAAGFQPGTNVVQARVAEDDAALSEVGADAVRLPFLDHQYRDEGVDPPLETLRNSIADAITTAGARRILVPLGLGHPDHRLTAAAAIPLVAAMPEAEWFVYLDLPYGYEGDEALSALARLVPMSPVPVKLPPPRNDGEATSGKASALSEYRSQLQALGEDRLELAAGAERYWRLTSG